MEDQVILGLRTFVVPAIVPGTFPCRQSLPAVCHVIPFAGGEVEKWKLIAPMRLLLFRRKNDASGTGLAFFELSRL